MKYLIRVAVAISMVASGAVHAASAYQLTLLENYGGQAGQRSYPYGMSRKGVAVGQSILEDQIGAVKWVDGLAVPLARLGQGASAALNANDNGQFVGEIRQTPSSNPQPALWDSDGSCLPLKGLVTGADAGAVAIANSGLVAGWSSISQGSGAPIAVTWNGSSRPKKLGQLSGSRLSGAASVSETGWIGGFSILVDGLSHATLWKSRAPRDLGVGLGGGAAVTSVNRVGVAAGWSARLEGDFIRPMLWRDGIATELGTLDGTNARAFGINSRGTVVGYGGASSALHAILWQGEKTIDLNSKLDSDSKAAGWVLETAIAIDEQGAILGFARNIKTGAGLPYLLTPN